MDYSSQTLTACLNNSGKTLQKFAKSRSCHKLNDSNNLLKSMEEYRQEYGKGMSLSHTLEDS